MLGKSDAPGKPTTYKTTTNFLKMFGYSNLEELPDLPKYKMDENQQIVIDDLVEQNEEEKIEEVKESMEPEREKDSKDELKN